MIYPDQVDACKSQAVVAIDRSTAAPFAVWVPANKRHPVCRPITNYNPGDLGRIVTVFYDPSGPDCTIERATAESCTRMAG
jgi:hypothetical protein